MLNIPNTIQLLEGTKSTIRQARNRYLAVGPDWETTFDARANFFMGTRTTLTLAQAHLMVLQENLSALSWWEARSPNFSKEFLPSMIVESEVIYRFFTIHMTFSQMEESLRKIVEAFDRAWYETRPRSITAITNLLCSRLSMETWAELFRFCHAVRNSIHNNGWYRPDDGTDRELNLYGRRYELKAGRPIDFLSWDSICQLISGVTEAMLAIVLARPIADLPYVDRGVRPYIR